MSDKPIRTFVSGKDACPLMNRGKAWLRTVDAMEPFGAGNPLNELIRNSLGNRTLVGLDGSVLRTQRGPINFVSATVPKVQDIAAPEQSPMSYTICYLAIDVWQLPTGGTLEHPGAPLVKLGILISRTDDLVNWEFIEAPTIQAELVTQPLRCTDPNYRNRADNLGIDYQGLRLYEIYPENYNGRDIIENPISPSYYEWSGAAPNWHERKWPMASTQNQRGKEYRSAYFGGGDVLIPFEQSYWDADLTVTDMFHASASGSVVYRNYYHWAYGCYYAIDDFSTVGVVANGEASWSAGPEYETVIEVFGHKVNVGGGYKEGSPAGAASSIWILPWLSAPSTEDFWKYTVRIAQGSAPVAIPIITASFYATDIRHKYYSNFNVRDYSVVFAFTNNAAGSHSITLGVATSRGVENHATFPIDYDPTMEFGDTAVSPEFPYERLYLFSTVVGGRELIVSANPRLLVGAPSTGLPSANIVLQ